jgi:predicted transposase/invertase (TIGR01784 family)
MKQQATPVFIDPTTDFGFKRIFGTEANKDLLISFLNELFRGRKLIEDLCYNKNEHVGDTEEVGTVIFDLTCTASDGEQFIIEVQRTPQTNLKKRMLYYGSKLIADQAPKGNRRGWGYTISEVYVIVLLDGFPMPDGNSSTDYLHDICLCNRDSGEVFYEHLGFIYVELINFTKGEQELAVDLDRWLHVLKNMSKMDKLPTYLRKPVFEKLFAIAAYSKLNKEERDMYDASLKNKWDAESIRQTAILEQKKARERGLEEGREEGMKEGLKKGEHQKAIAIARDMKKDGIALDQIAKFTKLTVEEIEDLK